MALMKTEVRSIDKDNPAIRELMHAADNLMFGRLVVAPTETQYGLLVRADKQVTIERLYRAKARDLNQPTSIFVQNPEDIASYGKVNDFAQKLIDAFMPGPLTLVLEAITDWPAPRVVDGKIGVRCSSTVLIRKILEMLDFPISSTSANLSGRRDRCTVEEIKADLGDKVELYLDAGPLTGEPSTVVDCSDETPRILRVGAISAREIERIAGSNND